MMTAKKNTVIIGLIQTHVDDEINSNMENTISKIRDAAKKSAQIICLQELYRTKYFPTDDRKDVTQLAETIPGETTIALSDLARELNVVIIAPIFEVDSGKHYNTAVVIDTDGKIIGSYRKMHIPHDPLFYEKSYFQIGDLGYQICRTPHLCFGVLICYDQWFPEAARTLALQGADLIFYPSAIGYLEGDPLSQEDWHYSWENIQRSHAIANGIHVASVNRVGTEGEIRFWGASFVCDEFGRMIKRASQEDEEVVVAELDISQNKRIQDGWGFLRNRLPLTYGLINSRILNETPKSLGYSMPAEWEKHDATWLAWPHDPTTFPSRVKKIENIYLQMILALHKSENINLFVTDLNMKSRVTKLLVKKGIDTQKINKYLIIYFGINHIIWLKSGVVGDDTDGHIDNLARFVNPRTVLCAYEEDKSDENHSILRVNYETLLQSTDQDGKKLKVIKMPMPPVIRINVRGNKTRLPASYLNFYVANKAILVPIFKHKNDRLALRIIQEQFPGRKVVGIDCRDMIYGMGAIHCVIQQQPTVI